MKNPILLSKAVFLTSHYSQEIYKSETDKGDFKRHGLKAFEKRPEI